MRTNLVLVLAVPFFLLSILPAGSTERQTKDGAFGPDDDVVISSNTAWSEGSYSARSLLVTGGATLTIAGGSSL
ncbi:MAG TPA: hypothetical protein PKW42_10625, partial [bacterium]|nr:hypothetical protein [bacterium]